ncbi:hypothetical protein BDV95DRAFT_592379 [Massariosphaeria phaeospora]|uniref:RING-type domain-containing protein n=1 Tax=Massariosphaeria phaeospora TaxID=100035 RepID=A0A7C8MDX5_9PLEO|nr:hypothetical protein BDV95DRAFT_592379 [Massariosphaeria phaeospora]
MDSRPRMTEPYPRLVFDWHNRSQKFILRFRLSPAHLRYHSLMAIRRRQIAEIAHRMLDSPRDAFFTGRGTLLDMRNGFFYSIMTLYGSLHHPWSSMDGRFPHTMSEWDEGFGDQDGDSYWRDVAGIPQSAAGTFFPIPDGRLQFPCLERLFVEHLNRNPLSIYKPDRRMVCYQRGIAAALMNPVVNVEQAIKDAWIFKMEGSPYCLSWMEPRDRRESWTREVESNGDFREAFLKTFELSRIGPRALLSQNNWRTCSVDNTLDVVLICNRLLGTMNQQNQLRKDLARRVLHVSMLSNPVDRHTMPLSRCPICLEDLRAEDINSPDVPHRPVQTLCAPIPHVFGKSCLDRALGDTGLCPLCRSGEVKFNAQDGPDFDRMIRNLESRPHWSGREDAQWFYDCVNEYVTIDLSPRPAFTPTESDLTDYVGLILQPTTQLFTDIQQEHILRLKQKLNELRVLSFYNVRDWMRAFLDGDNERLSEAIILHQDIGARQNMLTLKYAILQDFELLKR